MESIIATTVTGVLTLLGVLASNSRSRAVMEICSYSRSMT